MKKYILDLKVTASEPLHASYVLLKLTTENGCKLPEMLPGQFVEVLIEDSSQTFLRRPISINYVNQSTNELWLLVHVIGAGTRKMATLQVNDRLNVVFPLGNGFHIPTSLSGKMLLVGGGVGTAPMLYLGAVLSEAGFDVNFLLGARSAADLLQLAEFSRYGKVYCTTEDGSYGEKGFVTNHSILKSENFSQVYACGPKPMMMSVASYAKAHQIECEVSLENMMACGVGACLCCVEKTTQGHQCVCKEGPVFNINQLTWQI